jgi:hypothetical protein
MTRSTSNDKLILQKKTENGVKNKAYGQLKEYV